MNRAQGVTSQREGVPNQPLLPFGADFRKWPGKAQPRRLHSGLCGGCIRCQNWLTSTKGGHLRYWKQAAAAGAAVCNARNVSRVQYIFETSDKPVHGLDE